MKSSGDLRNESGYAERPRDFDDLIRILDSEIRLITPTDPEGVQYSGVEKAGLGQPAPSRQVLPAHSRLPGPSLREC